MPVILIVGSALNYVVFGPLGAVIMGGLEFALVVFVLLGYVVLRRSRPTE